MAKAMRVRTDDMVQVIGGKDAGKKGKVVRTEPKRRFVYVEGINMVKRHEKPRPVEGKGQGGGIGEREGPTHLSTVTLPHPNDANPTGVGMRDGKGGKRERYAKRSGGAI